MTSEVEGTHQIGDSSFYTKSWLPEGPPKATLIFIHGFNDHINRYYILFPYLSSRGIAVHGFDQRGWGRSVKDPSQRGLSGPTSLVMSDIASFIKSHLPNETPLFVAGHSMGGGEILTFASDPAYQELVGSVRGWLMESPFLGFPKGFEPNFLTVFFGRLAGKILPHRLMAAGLPPKNLTRDPAVVKSMDEDPLLHGMGTLEGLSGLLDRGANLSQSKVQLNSNVKSLWLGHGTEDWAASYEASKKWFELQSTVQDKEFKTYEGWYHQLHADLPDNREVFAKDVGDWILARCEDKAAASSKL